RSEASILGIDEVSPLDLFRMAPDERAKFEVQRREAFKRWKRADLLAEFTASGLGGEAIVAPHERFDHPQLKASGSVVDVDDPDVGATTQLGVTVFLDRTPGQVRGPQPAPGAHTDEVLRSLGYDDTKVAALRAKGVI